MTRLLCVAGVLVLAMPSFVARAGEGDPRVPPSVAPALVEEAQASFRAGVELYAAGDYPAALEEFERAYRLAPTYKILFNLAQVAYQRRDHVMALRYFTRYLKEGGDAVEPDRRAEVEGEIERLRLRIGELVIAGGEAGSDVYVDDVRVGITPMKKPLAATAGRRRVEIVDPSGRHQIRHVEVTAGGRLRVRFAKESSQPEATAAAPPAPPPPPPPAPPSEPPRGPSPPALLSASAPPLTPTGARPSWAPWIAWGLTAVAAGGAVLAGRQALRLSSTLERELDDYPVSRERLDGLAEERKRWALSTDGALLATAVLGAIALYVTAGRSSAAVVPGAAPP